MSDPASETTHPDDEAVDRFAATMNATPNGLASKLGLPTPLKGSTTDV